VPITTTEQAIKVLEASARSVDYAAKRRHLALDVFPNDPVLVHPLTIARFGAMSGDAWGAGSLWRVYDIAAKSDGPVRARIRDLAANSESDLVRGQAQMMLKLIDSTLEPLTKNYSFEQGKGTAADSWGWWVKFGIGRMLRSEDVAHTGKFSVLCDGMKRGGPTQQFPITPGKYALVCFVYIPEGQQSHGTAELAMTLRDDKSVNLPSASTKIVPPPGEWTAIAIAAEVPEQVAGRPVKSVMPIIIPDGFEPGEKLYFDDVMLYRIEE